MKQINNYILEKLHIKKDFKLEKPKRISTGKLYQWLRWYGGVKTEIIEKLFNDKLFINDKKIVAIYAGSGHIYALYQNGLTELEMQIRAEDFSDEELYTLYTFLKENV